MPSLFVPSCSLIIISSIQFGQGRPRSTCGIHSSHSLAGSVAYLEAHAYRDLGDSKCDKWIRVLYVPLSSAVTTKPDGSAERKPIRPRSPDR